MLSHIRFEQLRVEDDVQEAENVVQYDGNSNKNSIRTITKKSCVSEADLNFNNCNRPNTIVNNQNHLITHKRATTENQKPESQDICKRKKVVYRRQTYGELIRKITYKIVIFSDILTNFSRYYQDILNQKIMEITEHDLNIFQVHYHGTYCTM